MKSLEVKIKYFNPEMPIINTIEKGDWIDLRVNEIKINGKMIEWDENNEIHFSQFDEVLIYTGIAMQLPKGYEGHIAPRSSTFKKFGLIQTNSVGVIDESYCGDNDQWLAAMFCLKPSKIKRYDRVVQFRVMKKMENINFIRCEYLDNHDRGGYGSTGYN